MINRPSDNRSPEVDGKKIRRFKVNFEGKMISRNSIRPTKARARRYAYECVMEYVGAMCEVCGEIDPYTLDVHHMTAKRSKIRTDETVVLCANCHARCHRIWGGNHKYRP